MSASSWPKPTLSPAWSYIIAEPTKEDVAAAERALLHALALARAVRRIVEHALPEDDSAVGEDRVSATELLAMLEREASEALERL